MIDHKELEQIRYYPLPYRIRRLRRLFCLSQTEFANRLGTSQTTVAYWETGRANISERYMDRIISEFGLPLDFFLDIEVQRMRKA